MPRVYEPLVLEIEPPYIGSAVSPTVDITETSEDVTVTITDSRGEHSYTVDKTDQAIADAEAAAANANQAAQDVQSAVDAASTATTRANESADAADAAASAALAAKVDTKAATTAANTATSNAQAATSTANTAAQNADAKAALANTAAQNADAKATLADNAATSATTAAAQASTSAANADTSATAANTAAAAADAAREAIQDDLANKADIDGYYPLLGAGTSDALMSTDGEVDTFAQRVSGHDGACKIVSLRGNTVRWNQLVKTYTSSGSTLNGQVTKTVTPLEGKIVLSGTVAQNTSAQFINITGGTYIVSGHKYYVSLANETLNFYISGNVGITPNNKARIVEATASATNVGYYLTIPAEGITLTDAAFYPRIHDLTAMFGAGNEPSTVAEFEALYPESYYPYDAGSLLSVNVEGMKTVGFNQWDEEWEIGGYSSANGSKTSDTDRIRSKNNIRAIPNFEYCIKAPIGGCAVYFYDNGGAFIGNKSGLAMSGVHGATFTTPSNCKSFTFNTYANYGASYKHDICINISSHALNGTYRPYREITCEIPPSTLFPDGILRSAGSAYDERTPTMDIKRVGVVDLGTLNWGYVSGNNSRFYVTFTDARYTAGGTQVANINCVELTPASSDNVYDHVADKIIGLHLTQRSIWAYDSSYTDAATFKAAMSGVMLYYELATPTEVAIDPPLNLAYPTEQGGTESIIIPTGEMSAAPTMAIVYAYNADGVRDLSQTIVATIEGNTASTNYSVGGYFVHAGRLYRATSAIATGETINPGTNCTQTTVMAELLALTA